MRGSKVFVKLMADSELESGMFEAKPLETEADEPEGGSSETGVELLDMMTELNIPLETLALSSEITEDEGEGTGVTTTVLNSIISGDILLTGEILVSSVVEVESLKGAEDVESDKKAEEPSEDVPGVSVEMVVSTEDCELDNNGTAHVEELKECTPMVVDCMADCSEPFNVVGGDATGVIGELGDRIDSADD